MCLVAIAATSSFAALSQQPPKGSAKFQHPVRGSGKGLSIGYVSLGESIPFVHLVTLSIQREAKIAGAKLFVCDSQISAAKALDCVKTFKSRKVEGILNFQLDVKAARSICAAGPKVPVIGVDINQKPCQVSFMGANNTYAGYIAGRAVGSYFKSRFKCEYDAYVSMNAFANFATNQQRMVKGYKAGFQSICGKVHDERALDAYTVDLGRQKFADVLTALPGANRIVVVGVNDDAILGALAAAKNAGRESDLFVSGQGADPSSWCTIKSNPQWIADTAYFPERYGQIGVPYLLKAIKGQKVPKLLLVPHTLITRRNIDRHYKVTGC
jgi:ribose transport system substrate-binding protein